MKNLVASFGKCAPKVHFLTFALVLAALAFQGQAADVYTLSYNNSSADIRVVTSGSDLAGWNNWMVDGGNQLRRHWFYYRIGGSGPEYAIDSISAPVVTQNDSRSLDILYQNSSYRARVSYSAFTGAGAGAASVNETINFYNDTGASMDLHFFDYSYVVLGGTPGGQQVQFYKPSLYLNSFFQTLGSMSFTDRFQSGLKQPDRLEVAPFNNTFSSLTDGNPTLLNNVTSGLGDVTACLEWDATLLAGQSLQISKTLSLVGVPEPSGLALGALGLVLWGLSRRAQK